MEKKISLPRLGETMETGTITKWCIKVGEEFSRGQIIAEIEKNRKAIYQSFLD